jgi:hypothetical protein
MALAEAYASVSRALWVTGLLHKPPLYNNAVVLEEEVQDADTLHIPVF